MLRERLLAAVNALRDGFGSHGVTCYGSPSAVVPVPFRNDRLARWPPAGSPKAVSSSISSNIRLCPWARRACACR